GAQIVPPVDAEIEAAIRAVGAANTIALDPNYPLLDDSVVDDYVNSIAGLIEPGPREIRIVHTAMHGVGTAIVERIFRTAGFPPLRTVTQQAEPDPDFPT